MKNVIWSITLQKRKDGYRVTIIGDDEVVGIYGMKASADATTPALAYDYACAKLIVKPWLVNAA